MRESCSFNYDALKSFIARGRSKHDRPLAKASLRAHLYGDDVVVRMYSTDLARFKADGSIILNTGGWEDSMTTRAAVAKVVGASVYTIAQRKKRMVKQSTRIYAGHQFTHGVPYENGCIIKRGTVIWHPWMKAQGIDDIGQLAETIKVVNKEKAKTYYAARRALVKRMRPMYGFVDARSLEGTRDPWNLLDWFENVLFTPPADEDIYRTLVQLVALGCPDLLNTWRAAPTFGFDDVANCVQRGMTKCVGASSWEFLGHIGALDTVQVLCREV